ncbi:MAG: ABC transporter permease [Alistipes sp.]|nr:ABC transporter permease [Paludibacteraceae bacterium]MBO5831858.1 ABC transporter permease [Alistipes sp.]
MKLIGEEVDMNNINIKQSDSFLNIIRNEFKLIFSDGGVLLILVFAMLIYTMIYSSAYGNEVVESVAIVVVDEDNSAESRSVINGLRAGQRTAVRYEVANMTEAKELFYTRGAHGIIFIPDGFERDVLAGNQANIGVILDGSHLLLYRQVLEQVTEDVLSLGASLEVMRLVANGADDLAAMDVVQPIIYDGHILHNPSMGYGSFVMPSIVVVIIQQTLLIGLGMLGVRRKGLQLTTLNPIKSIVAKLLTYIIIYGINLTVILAIIWPIFGFPYEGATIDVVIIFTLYIIAAASLGLTLSHLFKRREAPLMLLLWSSVPVLLLAGVSYPKEAFPEWLYLIGRVFPSSSAVNAYVNIGTAGASLIDVSEDLIVLIALTLVYLALAIVAEHKALHKSSME